MKIITYNLRIFILYHQKLIIKYAKTYLIYNVELNYSLELCGWSFSNDGMSEKIKKKIRDSRTITTYIDNFFILSLVNPNYAYHKIRILIDLYTDYTLKDYTLIDSLNLKLLKVLTDHF